MTIQLGLLALFITAIRLSLFFNPLHEIFMLPEQSQILEQALREVALELVPDQAPKITLERPKVADHGDVATNLAMQITKAVGKPPRVIAQDIIDALTHKPAIGELVQRMEIAGPGFINFRLSDQAMVSVLDQINEQTDDYGDWPQSAESVLVEFVSANPTGPLHVGHARQAALGDALCRLFQANGQTVSREFYYNDAGNQIDNLALSVQARARGIDPEAPDYPDDGYKGDYILEIAKEYMACQTVQASDGDPVIARGDVNDIDAIRQFAVAYLRREQDLDLQAFGLAFDRYFLESSLYTSGKVEKTVDALMASGHTYESDGALWLKTTELGTGDDKDRVMRKREGGYTYFVPDVAYHVDKWQRGFEHAVNIQGSDHHGTVARVRAGLQALQIGIPQDYPSYILHKMVKVMRGGKEVKISKRAGSYVTMRDLIDWVGRDAVRFFLIQRRADTEFVFDVDLARAQTDENPVYYVQYAHARICSILLQSQTPLADIRMAPADRLSAHTEKVLLKRLAQFPGLVRQAARELSPHLVAFWLRDCAADFHAWYNAERVLVDDQAIRLARLRLADATRQVIANGLNLLGVSAPERM
jgi:arginyl-tRNA synthetase